MKYADTKVVFREVPDEVTLAINISGCPVKCPGCHSSYLTRDIGEILDGNSLKKLIDGNPGITCVSFMGGDADPAYIRSLSDFVHAAYPGIKTCWYSGRELVNAGKDILNSLNFIKTGPFIEELGPLDRETTNQHFYRIEHKKEGPSLTDWTFKFRKKAL